MSLAILHCRAQCGIEAPPVTIEVFLSGGLPAFTIVGMAETAVRESKDRVRGALISSGFEFPQQRITVSLGPADMRKAGGRYDLAIALGILAARRQFSIDRLCKLEFYGELALSGELRSVPGILPAVLKAGKAGRAVVVPSKDRYEASLAGVDVYPASSLLEVTAHLAGREPIVAFAGTRPERAPEEYPDLVDVKGQQHARRALEIAAAGGHNLLFIGPPGTGKSMLAHRLPGLLPPVGETEAREIAAIHSVLGKSVASAGWGRRPFRAPHHTVTAPALVGGGAGPRPGEVSRAHRGVLFLDELPEFSRNALEALREPLETGVITISRAAGQAEFPAEFQLVAAMNPCPCGYLGDRQADCRCSGDRVANYRMKISGPLLDRIDLHVEVSRPAPASLRPDTIDGESTATVAARIHYAWRRQMHRQRTRNARLEGEQFVTSCRVENESWVVLEDAGERFNLSARGFKRVLRVSRTIADLAGAERIAPPHVAEALSMRCLDRRL